MNAAMLILIYCANYSKFDSSLLSLKLFLISLNKLIKFAVGYKNSSQTKIPNRRMSTKKILFAAAIAVFVIACEDNKDTTPTNTNFDRGQMLKFYAESMIIPSYDVLNTQIADFSTKVEAFVTTPNLGNLQTARDAYKEVMLAYQHITVFDFGASEDDLGFILSDVINVFPVSVSKIENSISGANFVFNDFNRDARGLQAIDYLLYSEPTAEAVVAKFADVNRGKYLSALVNQIKTLTEQAGNDWKNTKNDFSSNTSTSSGSSVAEFYNSFVYTFEKIKNFKLGLPMGKRPGQTQTEAARAECYYSGLSIELAKENMLVVENTWFGRTRNSTTGISFRDYILSVSGGEGLVNETQLQFKVINDKFSKVPNDRIESVLANNFTALDEAFLEISKMTRHLKSEMSSLLGISITYSSGDGD